jgi:hypothetical protein
MTDAELAAIRARCEKLPSFHVVVTDITVTLRNAEGTPLALGARSLFEPVADFLVHARADVPALLGEIARLRGLLGRAAQESCDHVLGRYAAQTDAKDGDA